jgi:pyrroline-5-carboxylate reductase
MTKIGFVGGGNMAAALIRGLTQSDAFEVGVFDTKAARRSHLAETYGVKILGNNRELVAWADVIVLAVKPQVFPEVLAEVGPLTSDKQLTISVAAGVSLRTMTAYYPPGARLIRCMPNTPATVLAGASAFACGMHATDQDAAMAMTVFSAVGRAVQLEEASLDAVTGLSGSGPAYVMLIIEALADGGVKVGLHRDTALMLAAQTVFGSAKLLLETGEHPGRLKDMVTSPGGTAIAGLHTLESGGLRRTLIDAVETASKRAEELGELMDRKMSLPPPPMR